jgi:hypothetical protein
METTSGHVNGTEASATGAAPSDTNAVQPGSGGGTQPAQTLRFDSSNIKSTYCNVCNATSTREEVVINFGINKTWDTGGSELDVQLEHRIILNPIAAKRLQDLLVRLIAGHEQRYGKLT